MKVYILYLVMLDQLDGKCIAWSNFFWSGWCGCAKSINKFC